MDFLKKIEIETDQISTQLKNFDKSMTLNWVELWNPHNPKVNVSKLPDKTNKRASKITWEKLRSETIKAEQRPDILSPKKNHKNRKLFFFIFFKKTNIDE